MKRKNETDKTPQTCEVEFEMRAWRCRLDAPTSEELPLTEAQVAELDRRMTAYEQNPCEGMAWKDFKRQLRTKP